MEDIDLDSRQCGNRQTVKCKIVSVDLDTLREKTLCPKSKSEITLDGGLAKCEKCRTLFVESICIRQSKVQLTASSAADNSKLQLTCSLLLLEQASGKKLSDQVDFIRSLIKTPFDVVYNNESKAVTSIEVYCESSSSSSSKKKKKQSCKIKS